MTSSSCDWPLPLAAESKPTKPYTDDLSTVTILYSNPSEALGILAKYGTLVDEKGPAGPHPLRNLFIHTTESHAISRHIGEESVQVPAEKSPEDEERETFVAAAESLLKQSAATLETLCLVQWDTVPPSPTAQRPLAIPAVAFPALRALFVVGHVTLGGDETTFPALERLELVAGAAAVSAWVVQQRAPRLARLRVVDHRDEVLEEFRKLVCVVPGQPDAVLVSQELATIEAQPYRYEADEDQVGQRTLGQFDSNGLGELVAGATRAFSILDTVTLSEEHGWDGDVSLERWRTAIRDEGDGARND